MKSFNATIVYTNTAHEDQPRCIQSPYPNVCEFNNVKNLRYKIIDLQYFLYRPDYILVEYHGYVFNVTVEDSMKEFSDFLANE